MASCGTDLIHHLDFLKEAEIYRRYFIKSLNDEYRDVSTTGDNAYLSNNKFFRSLEDFNYLSPSFAALIFYYLLDIYFLILWFFVLIFLIVFTSRKVIIS